MSAPLRKWDREADSLFARVGVPRPDVFVLHRTTRSSMTAPHEHTLAPWPILSVEHTWICSQLRPMLNRSAACQRQAPWKGENPRSMGGTEHKDSPSRLQQQAAQAR
jgi:hypothetical protein